MTYEQLRDEAYKLGYKLVKIQPSIHFESCICGRKYPDLWFGAGKDRFYKCPKCDRQAPAGKTEREAKMNWNEYIKEVKNEDKEASKRRN